MPMHACIHTCVSMYDFQTLHKVCTVHKCIPFNEVLYFFPVVKVTASEGCTYSQSSFQVDISLCVDMTYYYLYVHVLH